MTNKMDEIRNSIYVDLGYVDLGLPSGRLWPKEHIIDTDKPKVEENYIYRGTYKNLKGYEIPSDKDWKELFEHTKHRWNHKDHVIIFTGKNDMVIRISYIGYMMDRRRCGHPGNDPVVFAYWTSSVNSYGEPSFVYLNAMQDEFHIHTYEYGLRLPHIYVPIIASGAKKTVDANKNDEKKETKSKSDADKKPHPSFGKLGYT